MKNSFSLFFLYRTAPGRAVLKLLVRPGVSKAAGKLLSSRPSRLLIRPFIRSKGINLSGIEIPEGGFKSFNDFFTRKRRPALFSCEGGELCSPCDGKLTVYDVGISSRFTIKDSEYSLAGLLENEALAENFCGGKLLVFRLSPEDYHRFCFPDGGQVLERAEISGVLHCVRPIALEKFPVFIRNSRHYTLLITDNFGKMVQMEVGALLVGKIVNYNVTERFSRGDEKGYFEFGGSTVILILRQGAAHISETFCDGAEHAVMQGENLCR